MCVCLRVKFQVSSKVLTSLRMGVNLHPLPQNKSLKSPPRLGLRTCPFLKRRMGENSGNKSKTLKWIYTTQSL